MSVRSIKAGLVGLEVLPKWSCHWVISKEESPARSKNDNHSKAHHPRVKVFTQTLWHSHALFNLCLRDREGSGMFTILAHRLHFHTCPMYSITSILQIISFKNKRELSTDNLKCHQIILPSKSLWKKQIDYQLTCLHTTTTIPNGLATLVAWARLVQDTKTGVGLIYIFFKSAFQYSQIAQTDTEEFQMEQHYPSSQSQHSFSGCTSVQLRGLDSPIRVAFFFKQSSDMICNSSLP